MVFLLSQRDAQPAETQAGVVERSREFVSSLADHGVRSWCRGRHRDRDRVAVEREVDI